MDSLPSSVAPRRWVSLTLILAFAFITGGAILSIVIGDWIAVVCALGIAGGPLLAVLPSGKGASQPTRG